MGKLSTNIFILLICIGASFTVTSDLLAKEKPGKKHITPTKKLELHQYPKFEDDLNFELLELAIKRQIKRFKEKPLKGTIKLGQDTYPESHMLKSLVIFREILKRRTKCETENKEKSLCQFQINHEIRNKFNVYVPDLNSEDPRNDQEKNAFFTAYNTPTIKVSRRKTDYYQHGIYSKPTNSILRKSTRNQIDFQQILEPTSHDMFYAHDLFELYLLHIEGGGKVLIKEQNGTTTERYISFDGTNKRKFRWISTYMVDQGMLDPDNRSIEAQRVYLATHPEKEEEIYSTCPNYIYFKITKHPPLGNDSTPLTDNRSIATDRKLYSAKGLLAFVMARRPIEGQSIKTKKSALEFKSFSRFFLDQDTGGAIKGKARADLYFGEGPYSQLAGENITELGKIFFLIKKK